MKGKGIIIILVVIALIAIPMISSYNSLAVLNEGVDASWAQVENQLKRRADLIPNLVETVKGYAEHETDVIDSITEARESYTKANTPEEYAKADAELNNAITNLNLVVENYPDLKANENFKDLQAELAGTENRIAVSRMDYNETVQNFNSTIVRFPKNIFAKIMGFDKRQYFEVSEADKETPKVKF